MTSRGSLVFAEPDERPLAAAFRLGVDEQLITILESASGGALLDIDDVVDVLKGAVSDQVRNAAAMALVDLQATQALDPLVEVVARPELVNAAGTLVYALNELGGVLPLSTLMMLVERGSFEARAEGLTLLDEGRVGLASAKGIGAARRKLLQLSRSQDRDRAAHAALALDRLPDTLAEAC